jgi:hypothetical protein
VASCVSTCRLTDFSADSGRPSHQETLYLQRFYQLEHRWTRMDTDFQWHWQWYPSRPGRNHWVRHAVGRPKVFLSVFVCVHLWFKALFSISRPTPRKPGNFVRQNLRKPQQNRPSSTPVNPNFFWPSLPLPDLPPSHPGNGERRRGGIARPFIGPRLCPARRGISRSVSPPEPC